MTTSVLLAVNDFTGPWFRIAQAMTRYIDGYRFTTAPYSEIVSGKCHTLVAFWWPSLPKLRVNIKPEKTVLYLCDYYTWSDTVGSLDKLKRALRHADVVATANEDLARHVREWTDIPVVTCEAGVDLDMFQPGPFPSKFTVGWAGNTDVGKGVDLKGFGLIQEAATADRFDLLVADRKHGIPFEAMPHFYQQISCLVLAGAQEGTPNPMLEVMASGRPVVSTNTGLATKLVRDGKTGFITERTVGAIKAAIARVWASDYRRMGEAARKLVERWGWETKIESWREVLRKAQEAPPRKRPQPSRAEIIYLCQHDSTLLDPWQYEDEVVRPIMVQRRSLESRRAPSREKGPRTRPLGLLLSDQVGWAFHVGHMDLSEYVGHAFDFEHFMIQDWIRGELFPDCGYYDIVFSPYRRWQCEELIDKEHCLGALRSSCWFGEDPDRPPGPEEFACVNAYRGFQVVTKRSFEELREHCHGVRYLPNPVNMRRFPEPTTVEGVVALWSGNAGRRVRGGGTVKGFRSHILPACAMANVPLVYCEFSERRLPPDEMPAFYRTASVLVMASTFEGCSKTLTESMASGLAVISTDVGQISEMRENQLREFGDTGIILVPRETEAIADALLGLKRNPKRASEMGEMNRREVAERWSWDQWASGFEDFLRMGL